MPNTVSPLTPLPRVDRPCTAVPLWQTPSIATPPEPRASTCTEVSSRLEFRIDVGRLSLLS
jgi:hypothetical protein